MTKRIFLKEELKDLCLRIGYQPNFDTETFSETVTALLPSQFEFSKIYKIQNLILHAVSILKHVPEGVGFDIYSHSLHSENIIKLENDLSSIKMSLDNVIEHYIKTFHLKPTDYFFDESGVFSLNPSDIEFDISHDNYFSFLIGISNLINNKTSPVNYLNELSIKIKPAYRPKTSPNTKIAFYLLNIAFDDLLKQFAKDSTRIKIPNNLQQYLDEDSNKTERKLTSTILTLQLLDLVGIPRTERSIREHLKITQTEASAELSKIKHARIKNIDELVEAIIKENPIPVIQTMTSHRNASIEIKKRSLVSDLKLIKVHWPNSSDE